MSYVKQSTPPPAALSEAAGLRWLDSARPAGGPRVAAVLSAEPGRLELEQISTAAPAAEAAHRLGGELAHMHRSLRGGERFGTLPEGYPGGVPPFFGPADQLLPMGAGLHDSWGAFQAFERLDPLLESLKPSVSEADWTALSAARDRIAAGDFDDAESPSRIHGDLWSGNVLWARQDGGVVGVLIDPAACAGHRESDLALLDLFGLPFLEQLLQGYQQTAPLRPGWQDRIPVHQFFYLAAHWLLFGTGYRGATLTAAERIISL